LGLRRKKMMSGWMKGLTADEITSPDPASPPEDLAVTLPAGAKALPVVPPASAKQLVAPAKPRKPLYSQNTDQTKLVTDPGRTSRPSLYIWLVPLLLGLVTFAAALGYFLGRQSNP
jgi:hypothetical protein